MSGSKQRVGVLLDGSLRQRELSLRAGEAVVAALEGAGHRAHPVFVDRELDLALRQEPLDVAFLATRGRYASDGCVQGLLELLGVAYTGSGVLASALAMSRAQTKEVLRLHNLPTAPAYVIQADSPQSVLEHHGNFGFPVAVSPADVGLHVGSAVACDELELEAAVEDAFRFGDEVIVERFVEGRIVAVAVLDGTPLGAVDLGPANRRGPRRDAPDGKLKARFAAARSRALLRTAQLACEAVGIEGAALVEIVMSDRLNEVVRGIDPTPVIAPGSLVGRLAASAGLPFEDLVLEILKGARLRANGRRRERRTLNAIIDGPERRGGFSLLTH